MTAQTKTTLKGYFETGDYPTEAQFVDLIDSLQLPYQNVVVVDPAGNGDYTTLAAAMAAITDASVSKRYAVYCFGMLTLAENTTIKQFCNLFGPAVINCSTFTLTFSGNLNVNGMQFQNAQMFATSGTSQTAFYGCEIGFGENGSWASVYFSFYNCRWNGSNKTLTIDGSAQVKLYGVTNRNNSGTYMVIALGGTCQFDANNCYIEGQLSITAVITALRMSGTTFKHSSLPLYVSATAAPTTTRVFNGVFDGLAGWAAQVDEFTWSAAPFYNCVFAGTLTQFEPHASCVNF